MTLRTNSKLAGFIFLAYIALGIMSMILSRQVLGDADSTFEKLASIGQHPFKMRVDIMLGLLTAAFALILAVTIYALTRHIDKDLALIALCCRVTEGAIGIFSTIKSVALISLATSITDTAGTAGGERNIADMLFKMEEWILFSSASCFALGSTIYCYLFLRSRSIPVLLAWFGLFSSVLLLGVLPLQLAGFIESPLVIIWIPMLVFEIIFALWLLIKGVANPSEQFNTFVPQQE
jgi:hypothetical protein